MIKNKVSTELKHVLKVTAVSLPWLSKELVAESAMKDITQLWWI